MNQDIDGNEQEASGAPTQLRDHQGEDGSRDQADTSGPGAKRNFGYQLRTSLVRRICMHYGIEASSLTIFPLVNRMLDW